MAKTIYRLCLIACLAVVIWAGFFYYIKTKEREKRLEELTLVEKNNYNLIFSEYMREGIWKETA